jgi:hypothetical protein
MLKNHDLRLLSASTFNQFYACYINCMFAEILTHDLVFLFLQSKLKTYYRYLKYQTVFISMLFSHTRNFNNKNVSTIWNKRNVTRRGEVKTNTKMRLSTTSRKAATVAERASPLAEGPVESSN